MNRANPAQLRQALDAEGSVHTHEWDINAEGTATVCHCGARSSDEPNVQTGVRMALIAESAERLS